MALPAVTETQPFGEGTDVYKVVDKMFAMNAELRGVAIVNLKCAPPHGAALVRDHPEITPGWHMNKRHWITLSPGGGDRRADGRGPRRERLGPRRHRPAACSSPVRPGPWRRTGLTHAGLPGRRGTRRVSAEPAVRRLRAGGRAGPPGRPSAPVRRPRRAPPWPAPPSVRRTSARSSPRARGGPAPSPGRPRRPHRSAGPGSTRRDGPPRRSV
ncbi:MmcQ/YjbR family DNA-binding protein [Curtobacterium sp. MCPF17_052]|nr:MmcQ/YjbR family DNA-binding protein [Curtobacterium sp. MCPF17_052]WIB13858.1 MmcQ/YjbR family DNA-binding protein [Curtobacterium sp. MCPF17_052]